MAKEECEVVHDPTSVEDRISDLMISGSRATKQTLWLLVLFGMATMIISVPVEATMIEADHDSDIYLWPYPLMAFGTQTYVWGWFDNPSSIWYYQVEHSAAAMVYCYGCAAVISNQINFYSDQYSYWYTAFEFTQYFYKKPRQPGFEGAGTYDQGVFLFLGIWQITKQCESTIMRIPS